MKTTLLGWATACYLILTSGICTPVFAQATSTNDPLASVSLVPQGEAPLVATYYKLSDMLNTPGQALVVSPPYPFLPHGTEGSPIYAVDSTLQIYIVDDSELNGLPFSQTQVSAEIVQARVQHLVQSVQEAIANQELSLDESLGNEMMLMESEESSFAEMYSTNDLWLSIEGVHDGVADVTLHNVQITNVYMLASCPDLASNAWSPELALHPSTNSTDIATTVPLFNRSPLFFRARTWNETTSLGVPQWYLFTHFGTTNVPNGFNESDLLYAYQHSTEPNVINFWLTATNLYSSSRYPSLQLDVSNGIPFSVAIVVDSTNTTAATWNEFTPTVTPYLGTNEGWHRVRIGLRGRTETSQQTWKSLDLKLDTTPPVLMMTNPAVSTVAKPIIQIYGSANETLSRIFYEVSTTNGVTSGEGTTTGQQFSTNTFEYTTNNFQCFDVALENGTNHITIRVSDEAGNMATNSFILNLDVMSNTNPPAINLIWPEDGMEISDTSFNLRGRLDDDNAHVSAIVVSDSETNEIDGIVERDGIFWIENVQLTNGPVTITLLATNAAGLGSSRSLTVSPSTVEVTIDSYDNGELPWTAVSGTVSDPSYTVTVNDTQAEVDEYGNWTAYNVRILGRGTAILTAIATPPSNSFAMRSMSSSSSSGGGSPVSQTVQWDPPSYVYLSAYNMKRVENRTGTANTWSDITTTVDFNQSWNQTSNGQWYRQVNGNLHQSLTDQSGWVEYDENWSDSDPDGFFTKTGVYEDEPIYDSGPAGGGYDLPWWDRDTDSLVIKHSYAKGVDYHFKDSFRTYDYQLDAEGQGEYVVPGKATLGDDVIVIFTGNTDEYGDSDSGNLRYLPWDYTPARGVEGRSLQIAGEQADAQRQVAKKAKRGQTIKATQKPAAKHSGFRTDSSGHQLISQCWATTPRDQTRTSLGVGEQVTLQFSPGLPVDADWSTTGGSISTNTGKFIVFTAPSNARNVTVTADVKGKTQSKKYNVLEPQQYDHAIILFTNGAPLPAWTPGRVGAGMYVRCWISPTNVSFYKVSLMEMATDGTNISNYFTNYTPQELRHTTAGHWFQLTEANMFEDQCDIYDYPPPFGNGSFDWDVPVRWQITGSGLTNILKNGWTQGFTMDTSGTMSVSKFQRSVERTTNNVITVH